MLYRSNKKIRVLPVLGFLLFLTCADGRQSPSLVREEAPVKTEQELAQGETPLPLSVFSTSGVQLQFIPGGEFILGLSQEGFEALWPERIGLEFFQKKVYPPHEVRLSSFFLGTTEVTQDLYQKIMGYNRSDYLGPEMPVEHVSWYDAVEFCNKLSAVEGLSPYYEMSQREPSVGYPILQAEVAYNPEAKGYRLPSEAQWEYAARGGRRTIDLNNAYAGEPNVDEVSWHQGNSPRGPNPVGQKKANEFGLFDMAGNLWEWTNDWYGPYPSTPQVDPTGPAQGSRRVDRGGSWNYNYTNHRAPTRGNKPPWMNNNVMGFRIALPLEVLADWYLAYAAPSLAAELVGNKNAH